MNFFVDKRTRLVYFADNEYDLPITNYEVYESAYEVIPLLYSPEAFLEKENRRKIDLENEDLKKEVKNLNKKLEKLNKKK